MKLLGELAISPAIPIEDTRLDNTDGTITSRCITTMSGYTFIEASTIDVSLHIARVCPFRKTGGSPEVSELSQMPG